MLHAHALELTPLYLTTLTPRTQPRARTLAHTLTRTLTSQTGVYQKSADAKPLGGHSVKIVGYGEDNGVKYWTVANSWNHEVTCTSR